MFRSSIAPTPWIYSVTEFLNRPQEALGLPYLRSSFKTMSLRDPQCFNISSTIEDVREHSLWHPIFGYGIGGASTTPEDDRKLRDADIPFLEPEPEINVSASPEPSEFKLKRAFYPPELVKVPSDIGTLEFLLRLTPANRPYTWQDIKQLEAGSDGQSSSGSSLGNASTEAQADQDEFKIHLPAGHAILRTYNQDVELLPPDYPNTLRTFFRGIVRQQLGHLRDQLRHFDRLNMLAVIPELSLVVAASQVGRAALITLTRLGDDFPSAGPVVMFRLDLILPLKVHEDQNRPYVPLAGMAVAPLQASDSVRREDWASKRWRLIMHYADQTILSYELYRNERDELIVLQ